LRKRWVDWTERSDWRDGCTEAVHDGGQWIRADAPLERIPLYLRGEAELPIRRDQS